MFSSLFPCCLAPLLLVCAIALSAPPSAEVKPVVDGNTQFAFDLYAKLKDTKGNLFFSPFSISTALAMTSTGAQDETLLQMIKTLHLSNYPHPGYAELISKLNGADPKAYQLSVANALFGQKGYHWLPAFMEATAKNYQAGLREVDYQTHAEAARKEINDWVEGKTNQKIKNLMPSGSIDSRTRLVLVNAIYFKGSWKQAFDPKKTSKAPFTVSSSEKADVQLMGMKNKLSYFETDEFQMVALPYTKEELSMVILLPKKADGLNNLEKTLTAEALAQWTAAMKPTQDVTVELPKFKLEQQFDLGNTLAGMGMPDAFSPKANFSGMDGKKDLSISKVVHKSFVEVNEEGTEAAAATGIAMKAMAIRNEKPNPIVRCDHPFVFMIRDNQTGSILFLGRLSDPK